jgi:hypothetical protein
MEGKTFSDGSKIPSSTWMHPLLFIDFAMYINPEFKYQVLKFVCDDMIKYRNEAGDNCNELKKVLSKYTPEEQMEKMMTMVSIGVNRAIFGIHKKGIRNMYPDEKIQKELADLEKKLIMLIEDGYIKNIFDLDNFFNKEYDKRWKKN